MFRHLRIIENPLEQSRRDEIPVEKINHDFSSPVGTKHRLPKIEASPHSPMREIKINHINYIPHTALLIGKT
jgi:hypothetical protein